MESSLPDFSKKKSHCSRALRDVKRNPSGPYDPSFVQGMEKEWLPKPTSSPGFIGLAEPGGLRSSAPHTRVLGRRRHPPETVGILRPNPARPALSEVPKAEREDLGVASRASPCPSGPPAAAHGFPRRPSSALRPGALTQAAQGHPPHLRRRSWDVHPEKLALPRLLARSPDLSLPAHLARTALR